MMNMEKTKPAGNGKTKKMKEVILMAIEVDRDTPVRMARIVENYTKGALREFIEEWDREYGYGLSADELDELVNGVWNDGDKWWFDEAWCIQVYRD